MIVAAGAPQRQPQERLANRVDVVIDHVTHDLLFVGVTSIPDTIRQKCRRDQAGPMDFLAWWRWQQIARHLQADEFIVRQIAVE